MLRAHLTGINAPLESKPSPAISSKKLPPLGKMSTRLELSVQPDESWSEPLFTGQLASLLSLYDDQDSRLLASFIHPIIYPFSTLAPDGHIPPFPQLLHTPSPPSLLDSARLSLLFCLHSTSSF